jgi:hypothetical protein
MIMVAQEGAKGEMKMSGQTENNPHTEQNQTNFFRVVPGAIEMLGPKKTEPFFASVVFSQEGVGRMVQILITFFPDGRMAFSEPELKDLRLTP